MQRMLEEQCVQLLNVIIYVPLLVLDFFNMSYRIDYRRVVFMTESLPYLGIGEIGQFSAEVHGDLSRIGNLACPLVGEKVGHRYIEVLGGYFLNVVNINGEKSSFANN